MLAPTSGSSQASHRSEARRVPTAELPRLVDRILDDRSQARPEGVVSEGPVRPSRSLLTVIRRLLERPEAEA